VLRCLRDRPAAPVLARTAGWRSRCPHGIDVL
jgi:hypothetical protein